VIKEFGGANESPRFMENSSPKRTPTRTSKTISKQDPVPKVNSNAVVSTRPPSKSTSSNTRVLKNESFFKNAKQADVILTNKQ